jgi:hypothetical protein
MTVQDMYDAAVETGRLADLEDVPEAPVQGPAAPSEADCAIATSMTAEAMADPSIWFGTRQAYAEAEAATYAAAHHLGLDESTPEPPELEAGS